MDVFDAGVDERYIALVFVDIVFFKHPSL